jgi:hypothetical protein
MTRMEQLLLSNAVAMSWCTLISTVSVEWKEWYADRRLSCSLCLSKWSSILDATTFSMILDRFCCRIHEHSQWVYPKVQCLDRDSTAYLWNKLETSVKTTTWTTIDTPMISRFTSQYLQIYFSNMSMKLTLCLYDIREWMCFL